MPFCIKLLCHGLHSLGYKLWPCYIQFCRITGPDYIYIHIYYVKYAILYFTKTSGYGTVANKHIVHILVTLSI